MARRQALGRGLKALIPDGPAQRAGLEELPLDAIEPNPEQPRTRFDEEALAELAASISVHGVLQPLLVSQVDDGRFRLIAGERRWRAARQAGLEAVPAVVRERLDAGAEYELALVENLQRRNLSPLEEARAYAHLRSELGLSQAQIAQRVGIDRSTVANALRLLKLGEAVQELVEEGSLSGGHARALLAFGSRDEQLDWARRAAEEGLSVRRLEREAAAAKESGPGTKKKPRRRPRDPNLKAAEDTLALHLGAKVQIASGRSGGRIVIRVSGDDELRRIFDRLMEA